MHTPTAAPDQDLVGAEIIFGRTLIGVVEAVLRDPISQRVRRLITTYGATGRRVAVPMEWVIHRTAARLTLGVGAHSLDNLADQRALGPLHVRSAEGEALVLKTTPV